jgi:hypothetical protein
VRRNLKRTLFLIVPLAILAIGWPSAASAQGRRGRVVSRVVVGPSLYRPFFYGPFYNPYWDPWFGPGWGYPYGGFRIGPPESSLRVDVKPRDAHVYVDGYYAGIVDEFDGALQRLRVTPGSHEVVIYKEGFRSARERLYLGPNSSRKITRDLVPLASGETNEPLPQPSDAPPADEVDQTASPVPGQAGPARAPGRTAFPRRSPRGSAGETQTGSSGTLAIRVQPDGAEVVIDGEAWTGGSDDDRLIVQLTEGPHHIEVNKPGYRRVLIDVDVPRGETVPINVSLSRD